MTTGAAQPPQPPEPISWTDLIAAGRRALTPEPPATHPTQAAVRRAVSDAYYAAFHALAASNADTLIGVAQDQLTTGAWVRVYRGLDHGRARAQAPPAPEQPLAPGTGLRPTLPQPPERAPATIRRLQPAGVLHPPDCSQLAGQRRDHHFRLSPDRPVRTHPRRRTHPGQGTLNGRKPRRARAPTTDGSIKLQEGKTRSRPWLPSQHGDTRNGISTSTT